MKICSSDLISALIRKLSRRPWSCQQEIHRITVRFKVFLRKTTNSSVVYLASSSSSTINARSEAMISSRPTSLLRKVM